jgi:hypothetical protein
VAGGSTEIRAWRAAFGAEAKISFVWSALGGHDLTLSKDPEGYDLHVAPLGMGAWHLVAVAKREDFVTCLSEESVWQSITKRTTTPLDRAWMPALVEKLMKENLLAAATAHGRMTPGLLSVGTESLDKVVRAG